MAPWRCDGIAAYGGIVRKRRGVFMSSVRRPLLRPTRAVRAAASSSAEDARAMRSRPSRSSERAASTNSCSVTCE